MEMNMNRLITIPGQCGPRTGDGRGAIAASPGWEGSLPCASPPRPESPPLGIVHVLLSMDLGGLELVVLDLLREGRRLGQRVEVICLESRGLLAAEVEAMQVGITCLDKPA